MQVTDIIVCGHYGCGGVKAAMENKDHGLLEHWLHTIRNVQRLHQAELSTIQDAEQRHQRLVELNVQEACMNLFANPIVQKKQALDSQPRIHGWVYDVGSGLLKDVKVDFRSEIRKYKDIYR
jgi:carbonic anhydrase